MMLLSLVEARVLGSLMEKETTTPEAYPLSLNALVAACNQKSSREPVMQLAEREVHAAVRSLEDKELVTVDHGSRVERYENRARTVLDLRRDEAALLCVLLLRGPQTPGELRGRAERLFAFDEVTGVVSALQRMATPATTEETRRRDALVTALGRQPGAREQRYMHLLCGADVAGCVGTAVEERDTDGAGQAAVSPVAEDARTDIQGLQEQIAHLQQRVTVLEQALAAAGVLPV